MKNAKQRVKEVMTTLFPARMKARIFRSLEQAINEFPNASRNLENEVVFIGRLIEEGAIIFDIGANRGDYVFALESSGKASRIFAFEPIPELASQLRRMFPAVSVHRVALSNSTGKSIFRIPYINNRYFDTRGTLESYTEDAQTNTRSIEVDVMTLDAFCAKNGIDKLDFIKIDVEGHEWSVLKGGETTLRKCRPLCLVEIEQRHHAEMPISSIVAWVESLQYSAYFFMPSTNKFEPFQSFDVSAHQDTRFLSERKTYINNFFFVPLERRDEVLLKFDAIVDLMSR
ncbi:MAG: FkbM family methyltransferase [Hyphomicrobiaceae bacterium]